MTPPTLADDCERIVKILAGAPEEGLSLDQIQDQLSLDGEHRPLRVINAVLCSLGASVTHTKLRTRLGKVTKYRLKGN